MRESGIYSVWKSMVIKMMGNTASILNQNIEHYVVTFEVISLKYFHQVFYLFIIGISVAAIILIFEIYIFILINLFKISEF